ncbi:transposase family protein [Rhodococcus koreensis]|uniref:transposase family protein n=1 Tax=Rhodococcus koreensis TaxID=99653 RepID=UPI0036D93C0C
MRVLLPHLTGVAIDSIDVTAGGIRLRASPLAQFASCPACEGVSRRIHSRYDRILADASIGNRPSRLMLRMRWFSCPSSAVDGPSPSRLMG